MMLVMVDVFSSVDTEVCFDDEKIIKKILARSHIKIVRKCLFLL